MPYIDGKRVSMEEWTARYSTTEQLHTGPDGENPAPAPDVAAIEKPKTKRSPRGAAKAKAAIADALGAKAGSEALAGIDVSGLDAEPLPGAEGSTIEGSQPSEADEAAAEAAEEAAAE